MSLAQVEAADTFRPSPGYLWAETQVCELVDKEVSGGCQ